MGMTIDDCINKLTEILEEATEDEDSVCYVTDVDEPILKTAIETMRKYQKIKHIIKSEKIPYKLDVIEKVVEDGNNE